MKATKSYNNKFMIKLKYLFKASNWSCLRTSTMKTEWFYTTFHSLNRIALEWITKTIHKWKMKLTMIRWCSPIKWISIIMKWIRISLITIQCKLIKLSSKLGFNSSRWVIMDISIIRINHRIKCNSLTWPWTTLQIITLLNSSTILLPLIWCTWTQPIHSNSPK